MKSKFHKKSVFGQALERRVPQRLKNSGLVDGAQVIQTKIFLEEDHIVNQRFWTKNRHKMLGHLKKL
jgi:hypothetical protein